MNSVLNFSQTEKPKVLEFLKNFPDFGEKSEFEEFRTKILDCTVVLYKSGKLLIQGNSAEKVSEQILRNAKLEDELILGIDETGRGENFGPMVVAGVLGQTSKLREFRDSKKIQREKIPAMAERIKKLAEFHTVEINAEEIDGLRELGKNLNAIEANAINKIISFFSKKHGEKKFRIVIDGSKIKGIENSGVEFLPKADDLIPQVGAASIIAKSTREQSKDKEKRKTWKNSEKN